MPENPNGRGLLDPHELALAAPPEAISIPLALIDESPVNPRTTLREIEALAESIRDFTLLQPVALRRLGDRYELLAGHRRRAAYLVLAEQEPLVPRWREIPSVVRTMDDERAYLAQLTSHVHTLGLAPREEAQALERLAMGGLTLKQIGERLHRTESWASRRLRVFNDSVLSAYVQTGRLSSSVAEVFLSVKDPEDRRDLAERAVAGKWSQPQAKAELRKLSTASAVRDLGKRAREMVDILAAIDAANVPIEIARDLWTMHGLIERLATGAAPKIPSIEQAERAAGVTERQKARAEQAAKQRQRTSRAGRRAR